MTNAETVRRFFATSITDERRGHNSRWSIFYEGRTLYSYGHHWPMAHIAKDGTLYVNRGRYSRTTSKQTGLIWRFKPSIMRTVDATPDEMRAIAQLR